MALYFEMCQLPWFNTKWKILANLETFYATNIFKPDTRQLLCAWFLKLVSVRMSVCVFVCVCLPRGC